MESILDKTREYNFRVFYQNRKLLIIATNNKIEKCDLHHSKAEVDMI
jgi:hypothetical protein